MGFDFGEFFNDAGKKAQDALNDLAKVGVPALKASAEQWGIDVLQKMNKETQGELNAAVKEVTKNDPPPGSFGAALQTTIKGTVLEANGGKILIAVVGLIAVGLFLRGK